MRVALTKLQPPRLRQDLQLDRPHLVARLQALTQAHRLVLVRAPAGYGKTSAVAEMVAGLPADVPAAWISLDEHDRLPTLVEALAVALDAADLPWRTDPDALCAMADDDGRIGAVAAEVVNALNDADAPEGVIVLDDFHRATDRSLPLFVDLLLERLSPAWTLVVTSRHEPALSLGRLRARGLVAELRQDELAFTSEETGALAERLGADPAMALAAQQRAGGWPAGLRLVLGSPGQPGSVGRAERDAFDFLVAEVLDRQTPELRTFLLQCSLLSELDPVRCAALTGSARALPLLDQIERQGLLTTAITAGSGRALRLHDLLRDALQQRLRVERPDDVPVLLRRAATTEPDPLRRVALLRDAGADGEAAAELARHAARLLTEGIVQGVARAVEAFDATTIACSGDLQLVACQTSWAQWDFRAMSRQSAAASVAYAEAGDVPGQQRALAYRALAASAMGWADDCGSILEELRREPLEPDTRVLTLIAMAWHALQVARPERVAPLLEEVLGHLERLDRTELWYQAIPLPRYVGLPGTEQPLRRHAAAVLRLVGDRPSPLRCAAQITEAWLALWAGDLLQAQALIDSVEGDCHWLGDPPNVIGLLALMQGVMRAACPATVGRDAGQSVAAAEAGLLKSADRVTLYMMARVAAGREDADLLATLLDRMASTTLSRALEVPDYAVAALQATLLGLRGDTAHAIAGWRETLAAFGPLDLLGASTDLRLRLADALLATGDLAGAMLALQPLADDNTTRRRPGGATLARQPLARLSAAVTDGRLLGAVGDLVVEWQSRLDAGDIARRADLDGPIADATHTALLPVTTAPAQGAGDGSTEKPVTTPADEALTPREREVLALIARGESNKLIARACDLSPHTVKRHVANILGKLGCASRGQAAARYHAGNT